MQEGIPLTCLSKITFSTSYHPLLVPSQNMVQGLQRPRIKDRCQGFYRNKHVDESQEEEIEP